MLISCKDYNFYNFRSGLIFNLFELGYEVVLVCPYGEKIDYFTQKGIRFLDITIDRRGTNPINELKLISDIKKIIKCEKPDLVLTYNGKTSFYPSYICRKMKIPCIVNNAGVMEASGILLYIIELLYKTCEKKANCIMYQNSFERDYTQNLLKNRTYYRDLPGSGVDLSLYSYQPYPNNDNEIVFNFVGRILEIKGINEYLKAAEIVKAHFPNTRFVIYGDYDDEKYRTIIPEYEKRGIIEYAGVKKDMINYIGKCHADIHPSHYEGMTNVVLEHSACGRPCIGSNIPGVKEGIDNGKTGFLFEPKNISSLVDAIEAFIVLPNSVKCEMGIAARKKMEREFDRTLVTKIYLEEIKRILQ